MENYFLQENFVEMKLDIPATDHGAFDTFVGWLCSGKIIDDRFYDDNDAEVDVAIAARLPHLANLYKP